MSAMQLNVFNEICCILPLSLSQTYFSSRIMRSLARWLTPEMILYRVPDVQISSQRQRCSFAGSALAVLSSDGHSITPVMGLMPVSLPTPPSAEPGVIERLRAEIEQRKPCSPAAPFTITPAVCTQQAGFTPVSVATPSVDLEQLLASLEAEQPTPPAQPADRAPILPAAGQPFVEEAPPAATTTVLLPAFQEPAERPAQIMEGMTTRSGRRLGAVKCQANDTRANRKPRRGIHSRPL